MNHPSIGSFVFSPKHDLYLAKCYEGFADCLCGLSPAIKRSRTRDGHQFQAVCSLDFTPEQELQFDIGCYRYSEHRDPSPWCATLEEATSHWNVVAQLTGKHPQ